ncbi:trafficking kinesin-binding protein 2 isoform X1 [Pelobates fuscus]|uniref:trafficking kinesin-binding protein 2 isoform X1 n=1 Tax=Pelobates fuscus TaxID=191477 RepID=UPI002FE46F24
MNIYHGNITSSNDVYPSEVDPEMELVNMLEDELPQYKLRVDSLYLYDQQEWIQSPTHQTKGLGSLSPVLSEETFRYMTFVDLPSCSLDESYKSSQCPQVLGSETADQMTMGFNDRDMLNHRLAERDKDLELAAHIGQALLKRNHMLVKQNEYLEEQLTNALDHVNQLQHELSKKEDLLRVVSIASEESETDSSCSTPLRSNDSFTLTHGLLQLDNLHGKLKELEEENLALRSQATHLKTETITYEEKEHQLVIDCVKQISETNHQIEQLTDELSSKSEAIVQYQEQISTLLAEIVDLQHKLRESAIEKEELRIHLQASKEAQRQLTAELHELQDRNAECQGMLQESREELKMLKCKASPSALLRRPQSCSVFPVDSLAAEIEGTMRRQLSLDEESNFGERRAQPKRVFDTVKVANELRTRSSTLPLPLPIPGSNQSGVVMTPLPFQSVTKVEQKEDVTKSQQSKNSRNSGTQEDHALETAIHRLHLRRQNYLSEKQFFRDERERKLRFLEDEWDSSGCSTPTGSVLSMATHYSDITDCSATSSTLRSLLPEKLQIVKPIEGSQTLHQWQQLAQPNLGTILDPRPGVLTKGFKPLPEDAEYHLCDLEEDEKEEDDEEGITFQVQKREEDVPNPSLNIFLPPICVSSAPSSASNPGKCHCGTFSTFTFTTCRILHPSDITQVTPSSMYTPSSFGISNTCSTSTMVSSPAMSCRLSVGESPSKGQEPANNLSSKSNLAKLLQEQGISAKGNSDLAIGKPQLDKLTLPSTPPNSPSHSPCPSPLKFELRANPSESFLAVSRPAESFLQEVYGLKPTRNQPDLGQLKMNLVERLKRLGIARVVNQMSNSAQEESSTLRNGMKRQESAVFVTPSSSLLGGLRRNQSLPALIGGMVPQVSTSSPKMGSLKEDC